MTNEIYTTAKKHEVEKRLADAVQVQLDKEAENGELPDEYNITPDQLIEGLRGIFKKPGVKYGGKESASDG